MALKRAAKASTKKEAGQAIASPTSQKEIPSYLRDFGKKCVSDFDVNWVCEQLSQTRTVPLWYRAILTRMLVGWAIWPDNSRLRKSLAWHYINDQLHSIAIKGDSSEKSYYNRVAKHFVDEGSKYRKLYRPLGGFNSKQNYSIAELRERSCRYALDARSCLQVIDILVFLKLQNAKSTINIAKSILDAIRKDFEDDRSVNPFAESVIEHQEPIGAKNFEKLWSDCQQSIEFLAALYCTSVKKEILRYKRARERYSNGRLPNALDAIIKKGVYELPFESEGFQTALVRKAKYFSKFLSSRKKIDTHNRFPGRFEEMSDDLNIFQKTLLETHK